MSNSKIKEILAVVNIAGVLAGAGLMLSGCSGDNNNNVSASDPLKEKPQGPQQEGGFNKDAGELGPATGKKIRGTSG